MKIANCRMVYSKYDSGKITDALDYVLKIRDILFFNTLFRECESGWFKGEEYRQTTKDGDESRWSYLKRLMRTEHFWITVLLGCLISIITMVPVFLGAIHSGPDGYGLILLELPLMQLLISGLKKALTTIPVRIYGGKEHDMILWENRADHKRHLWSEPVFFECYSTRIANNKEAYNNSATKDLEDRYLEAARDLSWLRCLGLLSEGIQPFLDQYGEGGIEIEILEDGGCNDMDRDGNYTILIKGSKGEMPEAVIPVEGQTEKREFELPFVIGEKLVQKYRKTGIFDLSIYDECYEEIEAAGIIGETKE